MATPRPVLALSGTGVVMSTHTTLGESEGGDRLSLSLAQRLRHIGILGATGAGKSTLLRHIIRQALQEVGHVASCEATLDEPSALPAAHFFKR